MSKFKFFITRSIKQDLKSLCVSGSPSLAKHAVRAMVALFTSESTFEQLLKVLKIPNLLLNCKLN